MVVGGNLQVGSGLNCPRPRANLVMTAAAAKLSSQSQLNQSEQGCWSVLKNLQVLLGPRCHMQGPLEEPRSLLGLARTRLGTLVDLLVHLLCQMSAAS